MAYNDLDVHEIELIKQQEAQEDEIKKIYKLVSDVRLSRSLVSGRSFWVSLYNRRKAEYEAFCIKYKPLRTQVFPKITE